MTPFETRLIEDMKLFGYSQRTQDTYLNAVRKLCRHLQKPVEQITNDELRGYLLWHKDNYAPNTTTIALCGVKFCFENLKKPMPVFDLARQPRGLKLPVVLTREEVRQVLGNIRVVRHRACLSLIYSCGLRISEAVGMQVSQIDSKRMLIHVKEGKALRDRYVPLPQATLQLLRRHWKTHRHPQWLFPAPGRSGTHETEATRPLPLSSVQTVFKKSLKELAMMGVLHTWGRDLSYHPHVHMIVAGGGLWPDEELWMETRQEFLMPVKALSKIVAAKFRDALKKADPPLFACVHKPIWKRPWVVHSMPVGRGQAALKYLATYIFRPAISNKRLVSMVGGKVTYRWQDSKTSQWKTTALDAIEFIRRYLQHVLPRGFVKVRYYGLYAHRHREQLNRLCDTLETTSSDGIKPSFEQMEPLPAESLPTKPVICRCCGQPMLAVSTFPRGRPWPHAPPAGSAKHPGYRNHDLSIRHRVPVNQQ